MNRTHFIFALLLMGLSSSALAAICDEDTPSNTCFRADEPIAACTTQLKDNPANLSTRIALCEALAREGQLDEAEVVLRQGVTRCSGRDCQRLKLALSFLEERRAAREQEDPREAERKQLADRRFCLSPFNNERSVSACEKLLLSKPKDEEVTTALVKKLLKMGEASEALAYALEGRAQIGDKMLFQDLIDEAHAQRQAVVDDCLNDTSLQKCDQAYLAGADDEYQILRRKGEILTTAGQYAQAKESLDAAAKLQPTDSNVRSALAALDKVLNPPAKPVEERVEEIAAAPIQTPAPQPKQLEPSPESSTISTTAESTTAGEEATPISVYRNVINAAGMSF